MISQFLVALIGEKLSLRYGTKNLLFKTNHKKVSHLALELVWAQKKFHPFLPQSNQRIKKGEIEERAFYFLLIAKKSSLLCKLQESISLRTELHVGCQQ